MPQTAIAFGAALTLLGIAFYGATGAASPTALIPALVGILMALSGGLALRPGLRAHAMHAAALVGTLGFLGCLPGLVRLPSLLAGSSIARPLAVIEQSITAVLCLVFVGLCVRSFLRARRDRAA